MPSKFFTTDSTLQTNLEHVLEAVWERFPQLAQNQIAIALISYAPPHTVNTGGSLSTETFWKQQPPGATYRGVELIDPAELANLFYLVAAQVWLEQGMTPPSPELERAMAALMRAPSYDATSYILDTLSGTNSGPSLPPGPQETWNMQRNIVNRYYQSLQWPELRSINLNQKLWQDGPYGRERDFLGKALENRNRLSAEAIARLFHSIVGGVSVTPTRSQAIMSLLQQPEDSQADSQSAIKTGLPADARIWSLTGRNSQVHHEAAYIETESTHPYLLVVLTEGQYQQDQHETLLPFVSEQIFNAQKSQFEAAL